MPRACAQAVNTFKDSRRASLWGLTVPSAPCPSREGVTGSLRTQRSLLQSWVPPPAPQSSGHPLCTRLSGLGQFLAETHASQPPETLRQLGKTAQDCGRPGSGRSRNLTSWAALGTRSTWVPKESTGRNSGPSGETAVQLRLWGTSLLYHSPVSGACLRR